MSTKLREDHFIRHVDRIEREANDHIGLIKEFGTEWYETYELQMILESIDNKSYKINNLKKVLSVNAAFIFISFIAAGTCYLVSAPAFSYIFLAFIPCFGIFALSFLYAFQKENGSFYDYVQVKRIIMKELTLRKSRDYFY